jgi:hypothetical protein
MKYLVEVDEKVWEVNTYLVEAESEEAAKIDLLYGFGEGMLELVETHSETNTITNIRSVKPFNE